MKVFFDQLFDYNFYCNKKLIEACNQVTKVPEKSLSLFSHVLSAHHIWNSRITGKRPDYEVWQILPMDDWGEIHYENQRNSFEIITNTSNFEKRIAYESSKGKSYTNTLQDILFHVINHSTHHRSQMLMDFRNNGLEPVTLDFIFYKR